MKCRDCEHWGWGDDEGTPVWGWCWIRTSCPDPDIGRSCPDFLPKAPDISTALSTLQAENLDLQAQKVRWFQIHRAQEEQIDNLEAENKKLRAELEQVKREKDAAVSWAQKYTESIDRPCVACKHNTGDYVCTAICGNCGPMGTKSCKWEFDFSGELKED